MDLFNPPKIFNYQHMDHDLNVEQFTNPYIQVVWEDTAENFTQERLKRVRAYFEKKYNSKNVNVVTRVKTEEQEVQSVDVSTDILDVNFQRELMEKYLKNNSYDEYFDDILDLDKTVEDKIASEKTDITPFKKWYIKKIKFDNFLSFGDNQELNFDEVDGICAVESNPPNFGGKTVLTVDLLLFLFFNTTTKTNKAEEIFNRFRDKDKVRVEGEIKIDGENYILIREVNRKKKRNGEGYTVSTSLDFYKKLADGSLINFTGEQRRETEEFIKRSIGEMDDFLMTILTTARNLEDLIDSKPTARGAVLSRFLGLDSLKLKEESAKELYSTFSKSMLSNIYNVETLKQEIEDLKESIGIFQKIISDNQTNIQEVDDRIEKGQNYRDDIIKRKNDVDEELLRVKPDELEAEIRSYNLKIKNNLNEIKEIKVVEPSSYYHEDQHDIIKENLSDEKVKVGTLTSKKEDIEEELKEFEHGLKCQYCGIELSSSDYSERRKNELEQIIKDIAESNKLIKKYTKEEQSYVDLKKEFDQYERNKLIKENIEIQMESNELKKGQVEDKLKRYREDQKKLEENNKIDELLIKADLRLSDLKKEREGYVLKINDHKNKIDKCNEKIEDNENKIVKINEEFEKEKIFKIYIELFGKKGISKMIMRQMTPVINQELQRLLSDSAEFRLEIRISEKDEVEFWMVDNNTGIEKLMASGSGYERTIASLALRSVLSKICSLPKPNVVVFDEVFGKVSNENIEMVAEFFHKIKDYFEKIFLITHNPSVTQFADSVVKIEKINNVSQVKQ